MTSVFEYATPIAKLRAAITRSSSAVPTIWLTPPMAHQTKKSVWIAGSGAPVSATSNPNHAMAKGKPYRKRTSVAPSVPRSPTRLRCAALRTVCASAAKSVIGIHIVCAILHDFDCSQWKHLRPWL